MPSGSSSTDEIHKWKACVGCGHTWTVEPPKCPEVAITGEHCQYEDGGRCCLCGAEPEPEAPECFEVREVGKHCHHGGSEPCCSCGIAAPKPEAPECKHEAQGPWRVKSTEGFGEAARTCKDCGVTVVYSGLSNPECSACGGWDSECPGHGANGCSEPEAPEDGHVCKPGATLYYCPTVGEVESSCHGGFDVCCSAPEKHVLIEPSPPRPPNAVAYATEGGAQFEIALSGDATVRAIDGALIITHASAVLAITQVRPMET